MYIYYAQPLVYIGAFMDRYNLCTPLQKQIIDRIYQYLGFNEVASFEDYLQLFFKNTRTGITFNNILNNNFMNITNLFKRYNPEYDKFKCYWLCESNALKHFEVGNEEEYDPKGLLRFFVKTHFNQLYQAKR
jgi:hypothetical protein